MVFNLNMFTKFLCLIILVSSCSGLKTKNNKREISSKSLFDTCSQGLKLLAGTDKVSKFSFEKFDVAQVAKAISKYKLPKVPFLKSFDDLELYTLVRSLPEQLSHLYRRDSLYSGEELKNYYSEILHFVIKDKNHYFASLHEEIYKRLRKKGISFDEYLRESRNMYIETAMGLRESTRVSVKNRIKDYAAIQYFSNLKFKLKTSFASAEVNLLNIKGRIYKFRKNKTSKGNAFMLEVKKEDMIPVYDYKIKAKRKFDYTFSDKRKFRGLENYGFVGIDGKIYVLNPDKRFFKISDTATLLLNIGSKMDTIGMLDFYRVKKVDLPDLVFMKEAKKDKSKIKETLDPAVASDLLYPARDLE